MSYSKVEKINTSEIVNDLPFTEELRKVFTADTNWEFNKDNQHHYKQWLEYQLYLMHQSIKQKDRYAKALKSQRSRLLNS